MKKLWIHGAALLFILLLTLISGCTDPQVDEEKDVISNHGMTVKNIGRLDAFMKESKGTQRVVQYTIEGDPLFYVLKHKNNQIEMQYDTTQDKFGTPKVYKYTCDKLNKVETDTLLEYTLTGCSGNRKDIQVLQIPFDVKKQDTFEFVLKYGVGLRNEINTLDQVLVKDLQNGETAVVSDFQFTPEERQKIYKAMVLANYLEKKQLSTSCNQKPHEKYDLTVYINNRDLHYEWSECDKTEDAQQMKALINEIINIVKAKDVYKQLPAVKGGYE
ncbi:MAG: DUF4362 domain-containing protein [Bacillota bacterium]